MIMTLHSLALRCLQSIKERPDDEHHPAIVWAHELSQLGRNVPDEVPWCSSILNLLCFLLGKPRSLKASARSWLNPSLGTLWVNDSTLHPGVDRIRVALETVPAGNVIVVFRRGDGRGQADHRVLDAPGHVAVLDRYDPTSRKVTVLGGNQSNAFTRTSFPLSDVIGVLLV